MVSINVRRPRNGSQSLIGFNADLQMLTDFFHAPAKVSEMQNIDLPFVGAPRSLNPLRDRIGIIDFPRTKKEVVRVNAWLVVAGVTNVNAIIDDPKRQDISKTVGSKFLLALLVRDSVPLAHLEEAIPLLRLPSGPFPTAVGTYLPEPPETLNLLFG